MSARKKYSRVRLTRRALFHADAQLLVFALADYLPTCCFGIVEKKPGAYHVVFVPSIYARRLRHPERVKLFVRGFLAHPGTRYYE